VQIDNCIGTIEHVCYACICVSATLRWHQLIQTLTQLIESSDRFSKLHIRHEQSIGDPPMIAHELSLFARGAVGLTRCRRVNGLRAGIVYEYVCNAFAILPVGSLYCAGERYLL
jgi:hypothetical protein